MATRSWKQATHNRLLKSERRVLAIVFSTRCALQRAMCKLRVALNLARRTMHAQRVADLHYRAKLHSLSSGPFWTAGTCIQHARLVRLMPPVTRAEQADRASIAVLQRQLDVFKYRLLLRVMQLWKVSCVFLVQCAIVCFIACWVHPTTSFSYCSHGCRRFSDVVRAG
jgi:hypothetical protein